MQYRRFKAIPEAVSRMFGISPKTEGIQKYEHPTLLKFRLLIQKDDYVPVLVAIERDPKKIDHLINLLSYPECEVCAVVLLSHLAKSDFDITPALQSLEEKLYSPDANVVSYAAAALTFHHMNKSNMQHVDSLFTDPSETVCFGASDALLFLALFGEQKALIYLVGKVFAEDVGGAAKKILQRIAEMGTDDVRKDLKRTILDLEADMRVSPAIPCLEAYREFHDILEALK
ncbi:MAG: hypothetical protein ABH983_04620 [Candidatus Micrarchaeota archaeon]